MKKVWAVGTLAAFVALLGSFIACQQATPKPETQNPVVTAEAKPATEGAKTEAAEAKTETEEDEEDEARETGAKVELPAAVASAFKKAYPDAVINASSTETEDAKTIYEIESVDKGMNRDLLYAADGTVLECEEQIEEADVPAPVMAAMKKAYPQATITKVERTTKGKTLQYDFTLAGAPVPEASFLPDGSPVAETPAKK
jgi:hypothetical protein